MIQSTSQPAVGEASLTGHAVRFVDPANGIVEIRARNDTTPVGRHTLKPLRDLYGPGTGLETLDPTDPAFGPLLLTIEEPIVNFHDDDPSLTDAGVSASLDRLTQSPDAAVLPSVDALAAVIQLNLRLTLSLNDYSRADVRRALRTVAKSVARHSRASGRRGYLTFIRKQLRR